MVLPEITEADIEQAEQRLGFQFDEARRTFLKCMDTLDVQSCAGSGKTTLLVAKLDILARKWTSRSQGICVLSHTNVAKDEIQKRLGGSVSGIKLLSHPHFIGTIQEFVNRYLALPYLRSTEKKVVYLDSQLFGIGARNYYWNKRMTAFSDTPSGWKQLGDNTHRDNVLSSLNYIFEDGEMKVQLSSVKGNLKNSHPTITDILQKIKSDLSDFGLYKYEDMYPLSSQHLHINAMLNESIRQRFPLLLIDETQDTQTHQLDLLEAVFPYENSIVQRLGDANQAIYFRAGAINGASFPRDVRTALDLNSTHRFGQWIADQASTTTVVKQQIVSQSDNRCYAHTIFFHDNDTIQQVLPAFAELIAQHEWADSCNAHAIGAIGKKGDALNIGDYWDGYDRSVRSKSATPSTLIGFARLAQTLHLTDGHMHQAIPKLRDGIVRLAKAMDIEPNDGATLTWNRLCDLYQDRRDSLRQLNEWIYNLRNLDDWVIQSAWDEKVTSLKNLLSIVGGDANKTNDFCTWQDTPTSKATASSLSIINVFDHSGVKIKVGTIHSVKGETHDATLVLESKWYEEDIKTAIDWLQGNKPNPPTQVRQKEHFKRLHVGMTRPRHLLCLAIKAGCLGDDQMATLQAIGWQIKDLRQNQ